MQRAPFPETNLSFKVFEEVEPIIAVTRLAELVAVPQFPVEVSVSASCSYAYGQESCAQAEM